MNKPNYLPFITYDVALASALISKGFKVQSRRYIRSGKSYFTFYPDESLRSAIELYWNDQFKLNARTLLKEYESNINRSNDRRI